MTEITKIKQTQANVRVFLAGSGDFSLQAWQSSDYQADYTHNNDLLSQTTEK